MSLHPIPQPHRDSPLHRRWRRAAVLAALAALAGAPAAEAADTVTVDFESGPALDTPITAEYRGTSFVSFQRGEGYRPYRREAAGARSGRAVADIGTDVCQREVDDASECEFPLGGTTGRLTRSASSVTVHAGLFRDPGAALAVTVQLRAYRADGSPAGTGTPVTIKAGDFTTAATVTSPAADIARFEVVVGGSGALGAAVGIDDLTLTYPSNTLPDVSLSVPKDEITIPQGGSVDVPIGLARLNGSSGGFDLDATRLAAGVTAQFLPDPVPGAQDKATLRLSATDTAATSPRGAGRTVVITGSPNGNAAVAPGTRTAGITARVASPFTLAPGGPAEARVPKCGDTTFPIHVQRDLEFRGDVKLELKNVPAAVTASLDRTEIPAQGGLIQEVQLQLKGSTAALPANSKITVDATSQGAPTRTLEIDVVREKIISNVVSPATKILEAPQMLREGTKVRMTGNGFCPGTVVRVGQGLGEAPVEIEPGGTGLTFTTPRMATSGKIVVLGPDQIGFHSDDEVQVRGFRNRHGLRFENFPMDGLTFGELTDAFGEEDTYTTLNPCWPLSCKVVTPIPDPVALLVWPVMSAQLRASGGHCFGFSRAVQGWFRSPVTLNRWGAPERHAYSIPGTTNALSDFLDTQHALQGSMDFALAWARRSRDISVNVEKVRDQLASGNPPAVTLRGEGIAHVAVAYDLEDRPDGGVDIHVYDNNVPFTELEQGDAGTHQYRQAHRSVLRISADRKTWQLGDKSGDGDGFAPFQYNAIPRDPSLPGIKEIPGVLAFALFGSADGAARLVTPPADQDYLPMSETKALAGAAGAVFAKKGEPASVSVRGIRRGSYRQAVVSDGSVASVAAPTARGVRDQTAGVAQGDGVTFSAGEEAAARRITLQVATTGDDLTRTARVSMGTAAGGEETVRLADSRRLVITHDGAPTTTSFTLTGARPDGGLETFVSAPVKVGRGATITATPVRWSSLDRVRLTVRDRQGRTRARMMRSRGRSGARAAITSLRVQGRVATAKVRLSGLPATAAGAVALQVTRNGHTLAHRAVAIAKARNGMRTVRWTVPARVRGQLRLVATATLVSGGARPATIRRSRSTRAIVR
ncbi:MAG: hypothetical protein JHC95_10930 [Solirubrobacteraceae bacterium]|nr:hypothetical protein [Solirubrobacteraceae bacterium]